MPTQFLTAMKKLLNTVERRIDMPAVAILINSHNLTPSFLAYSLLVHNSVLICIFCQVWCLFQVTHEQLCHLHSSAALPHILRRRGSATYTAARPLKEACFLLTEFPESDSINLLLHVLFVCSISFTKRNTVDTKSHHQRLQITPSAPTNHTIGAWKTYYQQHREGMDPDWSQNK